MDADVKSDAAISYTKLSGVPQKLTGGYSGDNTVNRAIPHGYGGEPHLILIYGDNGVVLLINTSYNGVIRVDNDSAIKSVTAVDSTNFYVGNSSSYPLSANASGVTYTWVIL